MTFLRVRAFLGIAFILIAQRSRAASARSAVVEYEHDLTKKRSLLGDPSKPNDMENRGKKIERGKTGGGGNVLTKKIEILSGKNRKSKGKKSKSNNGVFKLNDAWEYGYINAHDAPEILSSGLVSGLKLNGTGGAPFDFVPNLGCMDLIPYMDGDGQIDRERFFCLSSGSYGRMNNSGDYPLYFHGIHIPGAQKSQNTPTSPSIAKIATIFETRLILDRDRKIIWENGAEISLKYYVPNAAWKDLALVRQLTGADFSPHALILLSPSYALFADGYSPILVAFNPELHPHVISSFVRVPDINQTGQLNHLRDTISAQDKSFCGIDSLKRNDCVSGNLNLATSYRITKGGFGGMTLISDGSVVGFFMFPEDNEPGVRVYSISPGSCNGTCTPSVTSFLGFYNLELDMERVADISEVPGSVSKVAVLETGRSTTKLCLVNLKSKSNANLLEKTCMLDFADISSGYGSSIVNQPSYGTRKSSLLIVDEFCFLISTDGNFPVQSSELALSYFFKVCSNVASFF